MQLPEINVFCLCWKLVFEKYLLVRENLEALIGRFAFYQLVDWATTESDGTVVVESDRVRFELGKQE